MGVLCEFFDTQSHWFLNEHVNRGFAVKGRIFVLHSAKGRVLGVHNVKGRILGMHSVKG
jgi:predicted aconitase with swiveling domain